MSLSTDVLSRATPTRLICRAGRWVLELSRLEAVDRDVYQPRLTRLEGTDSILAALRRNDEGQHLVSGAAQLMRAPRGDEDRAFEVSDGDWVPAADHGPAPRHHGAPDPNAVDDALRAIAELRAELAVLRASHARLRERVMVLEAAQSGLPAAQLRAPRGSRSQRRRSEPPPPGFSEPERKAEALANAPFDATQASPPLAAPVPAPAPAPPAPVIDPAAPPPTFEELAKSVAGQQRPTVLTIPALPSVSECLATLMGSAPDLQRTPEKALETLDRPHGCKLLDDEGGERGIILMDLRAAVLLGAALLALPRDEALRQVTENDPSEDALLAMSEICNNLTAPVNAVKGNAHVRSTALASVDVSVLPRPRARLDLAVEGGVLIVAMY